MTVGVKNSVTATGTATADNTTVGAAVATIAAGSLPAGRYRIEVYSQMHTITNPATPNNVELRAGTTSVAKLIAHIVSQNSGAYQPKAPLVVERFLDGATALSCNFVANCAAAETQAWIVTIVATQVGY